MVHSERQVNLKNVQLSSFLTTHFNTVDHLAYECTFFLTPEMFFSSLNISINWFRCKKFGLSCTH